MAVGIVMVCNPKASELSITGLVIVIVGFYGRYCCQMAERRIVELETVSATQQPPNDELNRSP